MDQSDCPEFSADPSCNSKSEPFYCPVRELECSGCPVSCSDSDNSDSVCSYTCISKSAYSCTNDVDCSDTEEQCGLLYVDGERASGAQKACIDKDECGDTY